MFVVIAIAIAVAAQAEEARGPTVQVVRIDGTSLTGEWLGSEGSTALRIRSGTGEARLGLDELSSVRFSTPAIAPEGGTVIQLADGGRLFAELVAGEGDAVVVATRVSSSLRLPFKALAGIRLVQGEEHAKSAELFDSAMSSRLPGHDVLITRGPEEIKSLRGRLEELNAEGGSFVFSDRSRTFQNEKLYGIVFAAGVAKEPPRMIVAELADGSSFSGELEGADGNTVRMLASFGSPLELGLKDVAKLSVRSPRVTYVSDLKPSAERAEGQVHRPWPIRLDRSVSAKPLSLGGRVFDKGLGVHSRTELTYEIGGAYEAFVATIGIDDTARPRGSVVFRVTGDGRKLLDSGEVRGSDEPRDVRVDVSGVKSLTLIVDYGEGLDVADHADWGGARLLKGAAAKVKGPEK